MLDLALAGSALMMGLAGAVHCATMCGAPCAGVTQGGRAEAMAGFQAGRLVSYAVGGAVVAASVGGLLRWELASAWLRPVWLALHLGVLALGLFLLWRGEQPAWMQRLWSKRSPAAGLSAASLSGGGVALSSPLRAGGAGLAWLAWPCGLLQSALMVAALASGPWQGAGVMAAFALGSSPGLIAAPWLLNRMIRGERGANGLVWAVRASGALLAAGSAWALGHGLWDQIRAFCG